MKYETKILNKKIASGIMALAMLFAFLPCTSVAESGTSDDGHTVTVGLSDTGPGTDDINQSATAAFQKAYIQAVAEYANWDIKYVEAPWEELVDRVESGDIDLLMDVSRTDERELVLNYSSEAMGTEMCNIIGPKGTSLGYDDFKGFDGLKLGYERGSTIYDSVKEYGREKGFTVKGVSYTSSNDMFHALAAGEVDLIAQTNYYVIPDDYVILAKCYPSPVYIVTSNKNTELTSELNSAMTQLFNYDPGFNSSMFSLYYGAESSNVIGFTKKEQAYINKKPVVKVYYETDWAPFEYDENGTAEGITPDVIRAIGKDTGIRFKFVLSSSTSSVYRNVKGVSNDAIMAVSYDYNWAAAHDLLVTEPYVMGSVMKVVKDEDTSPKTVAVIEGGYLASQVSKMYPGLKQIDCSNAQGCMDAVQNGRADCTFLSYYQSDYFRSTAKYDSFSYQPVSNITQDIALGITRNSNPLLFGIMSKSLQHIPADELQSILSDNSISHNQITLNLMMSRYPIQMALALGVIGIVIGLIIFLLISLDRRKRQNLAMTEAKLAAEKANNAKSEFLSRMSHDIRTPLNGIIGMTYLANEQNRSEEVGMYLSKIDTSSKFLLSLINDILDMSKMESEKIEFHPEPYPPEEFANYMNAVIRPLVEGKDQTLEYVVEDEAGYVPVIDKVHINQIVFNILSNAVKYTEPGGIIRYYVGMRMLDESKLHMHIEIADNGKGMSREFQEQIFEPFTRENPNDDVSSTGTGLGMAITKVLVDNMQGTISVESEKGTGSTFTIDFDFDAVSRDQIAGEIKANDKSKNSTEILNGKSVLLCEDNLINQEIAKSLLKEKGMLVDVVDNGRLAVDAFALSQPGHYDVILMDIRMPVMNGYDASMAIRSLDRSDAGTVPIIAITADAFDDAVIKSREAGMNHHIAKPMDPDKLYALLAEILR